MSSGTTQETRPGISAEEKLAANASALERGGLAQKLARWTSKGGLAILDQGLISGSNFLISVMLGRWLMPDAYGAYAVAFGIWVMLSLVYQSLVLEPMGVFGPSVFRTNLRGYLRSLVSIHVALSIAICGGLAIWWAVAHWQGAGGVTTGALAGLVFASPCLMLFNLARRTFYVELSPAPSAAAAFVYSAVVLAGLWFVNHRGLLSPRSAFVLIGLGALVTSLVLIVALKRGLSGTGAALEVSNVWRQHWHYGAWALASAIAGWFPSYIYFPLLSVFSGMEQSGQLKALMNLVQPFEQTRGALLMLVLPFAAGVMAREGRAGARKLGFRLTLVGAGGAILYWAIIIPLQRPVFHLLYSGRYMDVTYLLPALALGQVFWSATFGPAIALRAMKSPFSVFVALSIATLASLAVGIPAAWAFGLKGAIWGSNAADLFSLIALFVMFRHRLKKEAAGEEESSPKWFGQRQPAMAFETTEEA